MRSLFPPSDVIIECSFGAEAVAAYALHRPDWVLMDMAMPGMDGLTSSALIRKDFPEARIIIVTQHGEPALRERARILGLEGYVLKDDASEAVQLIYRASVEQHKPQDQSPPT